MMSGPTALDFFKHLLQNPEKDWGDLFSSLASYILTPPVFNQLKNAQCILDCSFVASILSFKK